MARRTRAAAVKTCAATLYIYFSRRRVRRDVEQEDTVLASVAKLARMKKMELVTMYFILIGCRA